MFLWMECFCLEGSHIMVSKELGCFILYRTKIKDAIKRATCLLRCIPSNSTNDIFVMLRLSQFRIDEREARCCWNSYVKKGGKVWKNSVSLFFFYSLFSTGIASGCLYERVPYMWAGCFTFPRRVKRLRLGSEAVHSRAAKVGLHLS